ncbi:hypothetical protein D3C87_1573650 [compost metagenome]
MVLVIEDELTVSRPLSVTARMPVLFVPVRRMAPAWLIVRSPSKVEPVMPPTLAPDAFTWAAASRLIVRSFAAIAP